MKYLLEVLKETYSNFYIGKDEEAWLSFSSLMEIMQEKLSDPLLDENFKRGLLTFIKRFEEIEKLKQELNYTQVADILLETEETLSRYKEFN